MSTAAVSTPRVGSGRKNDRGSYLLTAELKADIKAAAANSAMSESSYFELLIKTEFPEGLPRLVMYSIDPSGNKREIPVGMLKASNVKMVDDHGTARVTYTIPAELKDEIVEKSKQSHLDASPYLRRLFAMKFPEGLPHFGVQMFDFGALNEGSLAMA